MAVTAPSAVCGPCFQGRDWVFACATLPNRIDTTAGEAHGERVRHWFEAKKVGWYAVLEDPQMPGMSTVLDQAHNAIDRKLCAMEGFLHPGGHQAAFLTGLAHL